MFSYRAWKSKVSSDMMKCAQLCHYYPKCSVSWKRNTPCVLRSQHSPFITQKRGVLYVNLEEAGLLCHTEFNTSRSAAEALLTLGAVRVLVTDGGNDASEGSSDGILTQAPPPVLVTRVTGAGDTFMAAHIAAEYTGSDRAEALTKALNAAATYVSGESPS